MGMDSWEMKIQWRSSLRQKPVGFHDEPSEGSARYGSSLPPLIRTSPIASVSWMVIMERFQMISAKQTDGQWWKLFLLFHSSHSELWSDGQLGMQKWWNMMKKVDRIGIRIFGACLCLYSYSPARRTDFAADMPIPKLARLWAKTLNRMMKRSIVVLANRNLLLLLFFWVDERGMCLEYSRFLGMAWRSESLWLRGCNLGLGLI